MREIERGDDGDPTGEAGGGAPKLDLDRRPVLQFRGSAITSAAGLLPYQDLEDALSLTDTGADVLRNTRTARNGRHRLAGLLRKSVLDPRANGVAARLKLAGKIVRITARTDQLDHLSAKFRRIRWACSWLRQHLWQKLQGVHQTAESQSMRCAVT